jgi:hypothetical protein
MRTRITQRIWSYLTIFLFVTSQLFGSVTPVSAAPSPSGAAISSDLLDYPPGGTVVLTGTGWASGEIVHISVNDDAGQTWSLNSGDNGVPPDPTADDGGGFTYTFQLPYWFVATYSVTAAGPSSGTATTTFTDADGSINKVYQHWADTDAAWNPDILSANKSDYFEGEVIPHVFVYKASNNTPLTNGQSYSFNITYNYYQNNTNAGGFAYITTYNISRQPGPLNATNPYIPPAPDPAFTNLGGMQGIFYTVDANITDVSAVTYLGSGNKDGYVTVTFTYTGATTTKGIAEIYFGLFIANPGQVPDQGNGTTRGASAWTGGSLQTTIDIGGSGATSLQLNPAAIIAGQISGMKFHDLNGNGSKDSAEPGLAGWTIRLCSDSACATVLQTTTTDANGNYTFSVIPGTYYVQEVQQSGWKQTAPAAFIYGPITINAVSPTSANNNFGNQQSGSIVIIKKTTGGDATFAYTTTGGDGFPASFNITTAGGSGSQTYTGILPGTYSVAETPLAGWTQTDASCSSGTPASFTVPAGGTVTCTFSNQRTYNKDLIVTKTAAASFGRTYEWQIAKAVDKTEIHIAAAGTAVFNYAVTVTPNGFTDSGWTVNGKITVENKNGFDILGVTVTDAINNGGACTVTGGTNVTVPANGSTVLDYSCTYAAEPTAAIGENTATATWDQAAYDTPHGWAAGTANADFNVTPAKTHETITVVDDKTDPANPVTLGTWNWADGEHTFTYALAKSGVPGTCTDYDNTAKITETGQSAKQKVTVCVGKDLTVSKTAAGTFNRAYLWSISKDVDKTTVNIADGGTATFTYTVEVAQTGISDSGWTLSGHIIITNPNDWEDITLTGLTDEVDNGGTCTVAPGPYVVPKSGSLDVAYSCSYTSATALSGTNTATATWDRATYFTPTGNASGEKAFTLSQAGAANKTVHVTDSYGGALGTVTATDSAPFASATFTYSRTFAGVGGTCTDYDNTAKITETGQSADKKVTVCVGLDLTVSKTAAGTFNRAYLWSISKRADKTTVNIADGGTATFTYTVEVAQTGINDSGWTLSGVITITNPNDWEAITLTGLTDVVDNGGTCTVAPGLYVVPKSGSLDVAYSCSYTSATALSGTNTATATWDKAAYFTPTGNASGEKAFTLSQAGAANKTVHVTDSYGGALGTVTATDSAPFASATFTYSHDFAGVGGTCKSYDNTAKITETGQTASKTVTVCVGKDLTVSKTAAGTYDRTYLWSISKRADKTTVNIADGGTATFNYTVEVEQTGFTDSGWTLNGHIIITNPNDWEDITLTGLTDEVSNGGTCTVDPGPYLVLASGSLDVKYSCTYSSASALSGKNTATATWDKAAYFTPNDTASGKTDFTLSQAGSTNQTVHVTDSYGGALGTVTATDVAPFASATFTYSHDFAGVGGTCKSYDNTAKITETGHSASKTVTVCVGKDLTVSKTAAGTYDRTYLWKISKDVDKTTVNIPLGGSATFNYTVDVAQTGFTDKGWTLSGVITITNPNDWEDITLTGLTDEASNGGTCTVDPGPYLVLASGSLDVKYSCTYSSTSSLSGTNTATATWDKAASFTPTGSASGEKAFTLSQVGATNKTVHVTDSYGGALETVTATDSAPFAKGTFTYDRIIAGVGGTCTNYDNTAKITETNQSASKIVSVCVGKDLTVSKTAVPTFTRTFLWNITKDVDKTLVRQNSGSVDFNYTVDVAQTGFTDSGWTLSGHIAITNPNDWEDITTSVTDTLNNGGTCKIYDGAVEVTSVTVPKSGSKELTYTCTWADKPSSYSGTNTATATWNNVTYATPTGSASGTKGFTFDTGTTGNPTNINQTVTITDTFNGITSLLGTVTAVTAEPYPSWTFTYKKTVPVPAAGCKTYPNTAKIVETGQSASKTVTVCKPSLVTDSLLCSLTNDTFRLILTPDITSQGKYKLNASNPGQFYYNVFYTGAGNESITITLPYPWVTQGAVPIHIYSNVGVTTTGTTTCLAPSGELANSTTQVTLANYSSQAFGSTTQVTIHVPALSGNFAYINIHLDYGLKGTTFWSKGGVSGNDAISSLVPPLPTILDQTSYPFSDTAGGSVSVKSTNAFKKDPGIGGLVQSNTTTNGVANVKVEITAPDGKKYTVITDADGWYMWEYKWTGKAVNFKVMLILPTGSTVLSPSNPQTVSLKANGYLVVNFLLK